MNKKIVGIFIVMLFISSTTSLALTTLSKDEKQLINNYNERSLIESPSAPIISGPDIGFVNLEYEYCFVSFDPEGDHISYDIVFEGNDHESIGGSSGEKVCTTHSWSKEGIYEIRARAMDAPGSVSETAYFTVTIIRGPILNCRGVIEWTWDNVETGTVITGSFKLENVGSLGTELDWEIDDYPDWGDDWDFDPESGRDLKPLKVVTVEVSVKAPDEEETCGGYITVINGDLPSNYERVSVSIKKN